MEDEDDAYLLELPEVVHRPDEPSAMELFEQELNSKVVKMATHVVNPAASEIGTKVDFFVLLAEGLTIGELREARTRIDAILQDHDKEEEGEEHNAEHIREARLKRFTKPNDTI